MKELIELREIERKFKASLEKDFEQQRKVIIKVANNINKCIELKQNEARENLAAYLSNKYFDENFELDVNALHIELTNIGFPVK